jgi:Bacterial PH domain
MLARPGATMGCQILEKGLPGGISGLFGIYGRFYDKLLGNFHMYGTRAHGSVVITMKHDEAVVLTPNEGEEFATELKRRLNNLQSN